MHIQIASLPINKQNCLDFINQNEMYWTVFLLNCQHCNTDTMEFSEYTVGKNIALFNEWCQDCAKPSHPKMDWIDKNGASIFIVSGIGESFSSS